MRKKVNFDGNNGDDDENENETICDIINKRRIKVKGGNGYVDRAGYCTL